MYSSGTFTMNGGTISGNTAANIGGGVYSSKIFTMSGGTISGNTSSSASPVSGGGMSVSNGTFRMSDGVIYGNNAAAELKNTAKKSGAALYKSSGTVQYGIYNGDVFTRKGDMDTTDNTVRIVSGVLKTE